MTKSFVFIIDHASGSISPSLDSHGSVGNTISAMKKSAADTDLPILEKPCDYSTPLGFNIYNASKFAIPSLPTSRFSTALQMLNDNPATL